MSHDEVPGELQLVADDHGLVVHGPPGLVEQFLENHALTPTRREPSKLKGLLGLGAGTAQAGSEIAAASGQWVKLTEESAAAVKKLGLRESADGVLTGVLNGENGQIKGFVEFAQGPGAALANPANLAGAAGIMAQLAMQQTMDEITDYLDRIDAKLDDVLRAQKDTVLSQMIDSRWSSTMP